MLLQQYPVLEIFIQKRQGKSCMLKKTLRVVSDSAIEGEKREKMCECWFEMKDGTFIKCFV